MLFHQEGIIVSYRTSPLQTSGNRHGAPRIPLTTCCFNVYPSGLRFVHAALIHHARIPIMLELDDIVGGVHDGHGEMLLG